MQKVLQSMLYVLLVLFNPNKTFVFSVLLEIIKIFMKSPFTTTEDDYIIGHL